MRKNRIKILLGLLVMLVIINLFPQLRAEAAAGYTRLSYIKNLVEEIITLKDKKKFRGNIENAVINSELTKVNGKEIDESLIKKYEKKYKISEDDARICVIAKSLNLITIQDLKKLKKRLSLGDAAVIIDRAEELLYRGTESWKETATESVKFVLENRIADIGSIKKKTVKTAIAKAYIRGYIKGEAVEQYSHMRLVKPAEKLSKKDAQKMIQKLTDTSLRIGLSPDLQVLRTDNLPHNAAYYPYILDSFPDEYYDTGFNGISKDFFEEGKGIGAGSLKERMGRKSFGFVYPFEIEQFNSLKYPGDDFSYNSNVFLDCYRNNRSVEQIAESSVEFYNYALNIDYRTIKDDKKWYKAMKKYLTEEEIDDYIKHCIENKTIIECDMVSADPSAVYWYDGDYNCKVYAHMRVVSDIPLEKGYTSGNDQDIYGYLYPVRRGYECGTLFTRTILSEMYMNYHMGEWVDFFFNTNGLSDSYGCLNCTNTSRGIMIDYTGFMPWLLKFPF